MKLIIAGTRNFDDFSLMCETLNQFSNIEEIITGGCSGADDLAEQYAALNKIPCQVRLANWALYDRAAGPIRNKTMAYEGDMLIAFWDGYSKGTKNMIDEMKKLNKPYRVIMYNLNRLEI